MKPVATTAVMRAADAAAPVAVEVLVERAGRAVAGAALRMVGGGYGRRVVVVAGTGNNGADGRSAARFLRSRGARVDVVAAGEARWSGRPDLVIDAAFGTGFRGSYSAPPGGGAPVLAVDIPSGVDGDTGVAGAGAVRADVTVTMAAWKPGLLLGDGPGLAGRVEVADIGLPLGDAGIGLVEDADMGWLPARPRDTHKWRRAVWVLAGSPGMRGAAALCAAAAQRAGAGMIHAGSPGVGADAHPPGEAVAVSLPAVDWDGAVAAELSRFGALVAGPGLGRSDATAAGVRALVAKARVPTVVDADGLHALGGTAAAAAVIGARPAGGGAVVLTPHDAEFDRLGGRSDGADRIGAVRSLAAATGAVVLLKGPCTVVADPGGRVLLAAAGTPRLATAGTGDVLAGVIAAFLAAGLPALEAAALGAHVHGLAARRGLAVGLVAGDLPRLVAAVLSAAAPVA